MTLLEVLNAATDYLGRQGIESPRLNAEHLLAHVLGKKKRIELYLEFERRLSETERAPLRELVRLRGEGRPLQHLLGSVEFLGRSFICDKRALIPRPETEQLVELVLSLIPAPDARILDIGTGSGIISLTLALERPQATVFACDISTAALALAQDNAKRHGMENRVRFFQSDLLTNIEDRFDVLIANLPYITSAELPTLSPEVQHDPTDALDGGEDGLRLIERLVSAAPRILEPGALLALEIGHSQSDRCREFLAAHNYRDIVVHRDYQDFERFIIARYG